ncbi:MAG: hypothetical protein IMZ73_12155 [Chloroflexi bacterium]|jgi:hypothetical protein|nr:hypothetical protein [Chloroflexota bacterium]
MITTKELQRPVSMMVSPSLEDNHELSRMLAAAVVSPKFCDLLLVDPKRAIENGYQGETFLLSDAARYLLLFIHADSLAELARQICQAFGLGLNTKSYSFAQAPHFIGC